MTLGGALEDDLDALEATSYRVLPQTDLSGRQLLYSVPHSRGGKGLSTQSLVSIVVMRSMVLRVAKRVLHAHMYCISLTLFRSCSFVCFGMLLK